MKIFIYKKVNYSVDESKIQKAVEAVFVKAKLSPKSEASVAIVSHKQMIKYAKEYMKDSDEEAKTHPVLSFPTAELEGSFVFPPDKINHIGEIIVSYEKSQEYAQKEGKSVNQVIADLAEHGALHLVGIHHD